MRSPLRAILSAALAAAACVPVWQVQLALAQTAEKSVSFVIGQSEAHPQETPSKAPGDYAGYYAPYAIQALAVYRLGAVAELDNLVTQNGPVTDGSDVNTAVRKGPLGSWGYFYSDAITTLARKSLQAWQYQFGYEGGHLDCLKTDDTVCQQALSKRLQQCWVSCFPASGLAFQVWALTHRHHTLVGSCSQVSIAFRGTETFSDYVTDAHWANRRFVDDEYDQLGRNIDEIINRIKALGCYARAKGHTQIVSVGHSLGGGLAQFAALAHHPGVGRIAKVFAFNSSFVTAAADISPDILQQNAKGVTVDRIYQKGELISAVIQPRVERRYGVETPVTSCDPLVRTAVFFDKRNADLTPTQLHSMTLLATNLVESSYDQEGAPVRYSAPPPSTAKCDTDYIEHPSQPPEENSGPVVGLGTARNFYASTEYTSTAQGTQPNKTYVLSVDFGAGQGQYASDGSYLPAAERNGPGAQLTAVKTHRVAGRPAVHKGNTIRTAKS